MIWIYIYVKVNNNKIVKTVKIVKTTKNKHEIFQQKQTDNQKIVKVKKNKSTKNKTL